MSNGAQIGGVIGAAIGGYFGGPQGAQLGYTIGSTIGGYIDPAQVFGPQLRDAAAQTAMDGVPRTYGYGTFPSAGNLIWCSDLTMRKKTESSKGSPTETVTYHYYRSYAIAVCQGPDHGNGIAGYRIVKRNGKVVFDTRTNDELTSLGYSAAEIAETRAAQSKFLQKATFYYGIADQPPDPTIQAVKGADEVPGYSYTAYMVVRNEDLTELRGAVPQYEFVVSVCGERSGNNDFGERILVTGSPLVEGGPAYAIGDAIATPVMTPVEQAAGADAAFAGIANYRDGIFCVVNDTEFRMSADGCLSFQGGSVNLNGSQPSSLIGGRGGWLAKPFTAFGTMPVSYQPPYIFEDLNPQALSTNGTTIYSMAAGRRAFKTAQYYYMTVNSILARTIDPHLPWEVIWDEYAAQAAGWDPNGNAIMYFFDGIEYADKLYCAVRWGYNDSSMRFQIRWWDETSRSWPEEGIVYDQEFNAGAPLQLALLPPGIIVAYCLGNDVDGEAGLRLSVDDFATFYPLGISGFAPAGNTDELSSARRIGVAGKYAYVIGEAGGEAKLVAFDVEALAITSTVTLPIGGVTGIAIGNPGGIRLEPLPDAPGYYIDPDTGIIYGPDGITISECAPTLGEIVEDQCASKGVTTVDVTDLDDDVLGFRIANTSSPQKNIQAAQPGYFFDGSEFDGVQHFVKRGGEDSFHIPFRDMCPRQPDTIQWERTQEAELLRKVTFTYFDPRATYTPTSQTAERRAGTIQAKGESASQLPIVGTGDWAAQAAAINLKAAWTEPDECTFQVSLDWAGLVTAAVGTIEDERGTIHRIRIDDIKDDGLLRMVTARRTDSAAYQSNAAGKPIKLPTFPGSDIRGPVTGVLLNSPVIVDTDDRPGIYWAARGSTSGYIGASLQLLRSGAWVELGQLLGSSVIGSLSAPLPYHVGDIDNQNVMRVTMASELSSTTFENLLGERNALAVVRPDNSIEIVQFETATPVDTNVFELSNLIRNRLNTYGAGHTTGARVVLLDSGVAYAELRPEEIGQVLSFRMVSLGTNPDAAAIVTVDMAMMHSQTEWPVALLQVVKDGDDYTLTWQPRHRLGSDAFPTRSTNWDGYLVRWQYGDQFHEEVITTETITFTLPGASDVDFSVAQLNRFTGPGPITTVDIP